MDAKLQDNTNWGQPDGTTKWDKCLQDKFSSDNIEGVKLIYREE